MPRKAYKCHRVFQLTQQPNNSQGKNIQLTKVTQNQRVTVKYNIKRTHHDREKYKSARRISNFGDVVGHRETNSEATSQRGTR